MLSLALVGPAAGTLNFTNDNLALAVLQWLQVECVFLQDGWMTLSVASQAGGCE
jgi:hypothetical protein